MALDGCGQLCKCLLIIFNIIFAVLGFAILGVGMWLRFSGSTRGIFKVGDLNSTAFVIVVTIMIVLGVVMLIVVAFGDYGSCNESKCALEVFSGLVSLLAIAEIAVGVLVYARSDVVAEGLVEFYNTMYLLYVSSGDPAIGATLTFVHKLLDCCGVMGVVILDLAQQTCPAKEGFLSRIIRPTCPGVISDAFQSKVPLVMGLFIGTGVLLYIVLTPPAVGNQQPTLVSSTPNPDPDQDPVVFTPLTVAHIPVAET
ncbi:CD9 antigen [Diretmus argenteus]